MKEMGRWIGKRWFFKRSQNKNTQNQAGCWKWYHLALNVKSFCLERVHIRKKSVQKHKIKKTRMKKKNEHQIKLVFMYM